MSSGTVLNEYICQFTLAFTFGQKHFTPSDTRTVSPKAITRAIISVSYPTLLRRQTPKCRPTHHVVTEVCLLYGDIASSLARPRPHLHPSRR